MATKLNSRQETTAVHLTHRDITLIRCSLLRRMDDMKGRPEYAESYVRSRELLKILWDARAAGMLAERGAIWGD